MTTLSRCDWIQKNKIDYKTKIFLLMYNDYVKLTWCLERMLRLKKKSGVLDWSVTVNNNICLVVFMYMYVLYS